MKDAGVTDSDKDLERLNRLRTLSIATPTTRSGRRWSPGWLAVSAAVVIALQAGALAYLLANPQRRGSTDGQRQAEASPAAPALAASPAGPGTVRLEAEGFVTASRVATVSSRVTAVVSDVFVEAGDTVTAGQVIAKLDDKDARLQLRLTQGRLAAARSRAASAEAQRREVESTLARTDALFEKRFISQAALTQARTAAETAQAASQSAAAELSVASIQVEQAASQLDDFTIRAPFAGVVTAKTAQAGEVLAPSGAGGGFTRTGVCTIVDMSSLEIHADINEQHLSRLRVGGPVQARLYANPSVVVNGQLLQIMPNADRAKATVRVRVKIFNHDQRILPEMRVKLTFL